MSGTLFMVATPIGNLEDITLRALRVLREADLIAAEDTRRTSKLLTAHGISTPTLSFHVHNAASRLPRLIERLEAGLRVALVSDAGTPGVSDPGLDLVRACVARGIAVDPIPGPSAPLVAAVGSGFPLEPLTVLGFCPSKQAARVDFIGQIESRAGTQVFFETPHRIEATMTLMASRLGTRQICVARELTKIHQEFLRGTAQDLMDQIEPRGEFTIVVGPAEPLAKVPELVEDAVVADMFGRTQEAMESASRRQVVAVVAKQLGRTTKDIYSAIERAKATPPEGH
jgi:16S rRNA (cytidine1402-2'-O)-methyltransferase